MRGKGYASILLQRIHERLRGEGALCMYLMSEIGPTLYERLGYVARPLRICRFAAADPVTILVGSHGTGGRRRCARHGRQG